MAKRIAEKSPVALVGIKQVLNKKRERDVQEGLDYVVLWNSVMLNTAVGFIG